ncbi:hypothetical protein [Blastomonas aquatica]|uniref:DUF3618 domain-containing protein n=1 Tax=Blastomonas aquatica TaxID=1510276 RepID=A0ABQ1J632_9SPHN|nr:hypothetical protein [Blastomonas aquatica]GGB60514.1 hypothetical protein GCM10010833_14260 [Blastomonas aquatica]
MTDKIRASDDPVSVEHEPSLAEVAARRLAARSQWQQALARAQVRFNPVNMRNEAVETAADAIGGAVDKVGATAWMHRGKLAMAGVLSGLFFARKPISQACAPVIEKTKVSIDKAAARVRAKTKG